MKRTMREGVSRKKKERKRRRKRKEDEREKKRMRRTMIQLRGKLDEQLMRRRQKETEIATRGSF